MKADPKHSDKEKENAPKVTRPRIITGYGLSRHYWLPQWLLDAVGPLLLVVLAVAIAAGYYAYHYVSKDSVRLQFWVSFMFSFTALLVVTLQSVIYAQQAEFAGQQREAMVDSVKRTDEIIESMKITRELENRAWVGVKTIFMNESPVSGYDIRAVYVNGGNSPALCGIKVMGGVFEESPPDDVSFEGLTTPGSTFAFFPHSEYVAILAHLPELPLLTFPSPVRPFISLRILNTRTYLIALILQSFVITLWEGLSARRVR